MKLIVGLGNPGKAYRQNRHNVGFRVADELARLWSADVSRRRHKALYGHVIRAGGPVVLLKPQTFMNRSGESVAEAAGFYKVSPTDLLVVVDDMNLRLGQVRLRPRGSAGGHNGLKDIIEKLGSEEFCRLRVGIGSATAGGAVEHVLGGFEDHEKETVERAIREAAEAAECWCEKGIDEAMNRFNPSKQP